MEFLCLSVSLSRNHVTNAQHRCCQKPLAGSLSCPLNTQLVFQTTNYPSCSSQRGVQTCSNPFHVGRIDRLVGLFMSAALDRLRKSVNSKCVLMFVGSIHLSNLSLACNQLRKMAPNYIQLIKCWVKSVPLVVPSCVLNQHFFGPSPPSPCGITMPEQLCSCRENQDEPSDFEVQGDF